MHRLLAATLLTSALAGCRGGSSPTESTPTPAPAGPAAAIPPTTPTTPPAPPPGAATPPAPAPSDLGQPAPRTPAAAPPARRPYAAIDPALARQLIAAGAPVFDVREPEEYAEGHLPTATNLPLGELGERLAEVTARAPDPSQPVVVYCAVGARAAKARQLLERAGYTQVINGGGYDDVR
ncbi:MAG: rhodanese-like domain-containing protein [Kofleriaceae bacterium]